MKLLLLADQKVGFEITRFLVEEYPGDLVMVVTTEKNDIYEFAVSRSTLAYVFETEETLLHAASSCSVDLGILAWWPRLIKPPLFRWPRLGFINTHPSFLPHNRGKHYNFWALVEEAPFGVSLHCIDSGIDTGDIVVQKRIDYGWCDNGESLYRKAEDAIIKLFRENYPNWRKGFFQRKPQELSKGSFHSADELEGASRIHLEGNYRGREILNLLRARSFQGHPACWFEENGQRYEVRIEIQQVEK